MTSTTTEPAPALSGETGGPTRGGFRWYMGGYGAYFFGMGINGVIVPWLIVVQLHETAERLGFAQMAGMLPMLVLVLFGGLAADRAELRSHLTRLTAIAAVPSVLLILMLTGGRLSYTVMVCYAVLGGTLGAFIMPARDALLTAVTERTSGLDIAGAVTAVTFVQFAAQILGFAVAGFSARLGPEILLAGVALALAASAYATSRLPPSHIRKPKGPRGPRAPGQALAEVRAIFADLVSGLREVWSSPRMQPVITMMFLMGICGMGVFMVLLPILIRDVYGGGSQQIAAALTAFFGGIATTAMTLRRFPPIKRQGRAMLIASLGGACMMVAIHFAPSFHAVVALTYVWGLTGGISMTMSRTIVQQSAPPSHRARILSVFSLGFLGGGPIGSLIVGYLIAHLGPVDAILIPAGAICCVFAGMFALTRLWQLESLGPPEAEPTPAPAAGR